MESLPYELKLMIFKHLDWVSQMRCRRVCRNWKEIIGQPSVLSNIVLEFPIPFSYKVRIKRLDSSRVDVEHVPAVNQIYAMLGRIHIHRVSVTFTMKKDAGKPENCNVAAFLRRFIDDHEIRIEIGRIRLRNVELRFHDWSTLTSFTQFRGLQFGSLLSVEMTDVRIVGVPHYLWMLFDIDEHIWVDIPHCVLILDGTKNAGELIMGHLKRFCPPLSVNQRRILQRFCETKSYEWAEDELGFAAFCQFAEGATTEEEFEALRDRWENLAIENLEPLLQRLLWEAITPHSNRPLSRKCVYRPFSR